MSKDYSYFDWHSYGTTASKFSLAISASKTDYWFDHIWDSRKEALEQDKGAAWN